MPKGEKPRFQSGFKLLLALLTVDSAFITNLGIGRIEMVGIRKYFLNLKIVY